MQIKCTLHVKLWRRQSNNDFLIKDTSQLYCISKIFPFKKWPVLWKMCFLIFLCSNYFCKFEIRRDFSCCCSPTSLNFMHQTAPEVTGQDLLTVLEYPSPSSSSSASSSSRLCSITRPWSPAENSRQSFGLEVPFLTWNNVNPVKRLFSNSNLRSNYVKLKTYIIVILHANSWSKVGDTSDTPCPILETNKTVLKIQ